MSDFFKKIAKRSTNLKEQNEPWAPKIYDYQFFWTTLFNSELVVSLELYSHRSLTDEVFGWFNSELVVTLELCSHCSLTDEVFGSTVN